MVAIVLMALVIAHEGDENTSEDSLFQLVNGLPDALAPFFELLYRFGALWALGLVVVAALVARRWRLARDMAIAGVAAWFLARLIGVIVVGNSSVMDGIDYASRFDETPSFPVVRLAVIVAVIAVASPYLTRPMRRIGQLLILLLAFAALYLGTGAPGRRVRRGRPRLGARRDRAPGLRLARRPARRRRRSPPRSHELTGFDGAGHARAEATARTARSCSSDASDGPLLDPGARPRRSRRAARSPRSARSVLYKDAGPKPAPHPPGRGRARGVHDAARGAGRGARAAGRRRGRRRARARRCS